MAKCSMDQVYACPRSKEEAGDREPNFQIKVCVSIEPFIAGGHVLGREAAVSLLWWSTHIGQDTQELVWEERMRYDHG